MQIVRGGESRAVKVTLGELPEALAGKVVEDEGLLDGLQLEQLDSKNRRELGIDARVQSGVVVTGVAAGSGAAESGLQPGDVIVEANRTPVTSLRQFQGLYEASRERLLILVYRHGSTMYFLMHR